MTCCCPGVGSTGNVTANCKCKNAKENAKKRQISYQRAKNASYLGVAFPV